MDSGHSDIEVVVGRLRNQALSESLRITEHAHREMVEDHISMKEVLDVLSDAKIIENYPEHQRGACCLAGGNSRKNRYIHVVCTTGLEVAIIITVYLPKPPKWPTPFERGK